MKVAYADIYYIFGILGAAKMPIAREKLRNKVSCRGSKFTVLLKMLLDKKLILITSGPPLFYAISPEGTSLLKQWHSILDTLDMDDILSRFL